jgi:hypothetical protein
LSSKLAGLNRGSGDVAQAVNTITAIAIIDQASHFATFFKVIRSCAIGYNPPFRRPHTIRRKTLLTHVIKIFK